ncbi:MAG: PKD domain-containing protein [Panacibacter sp.]
MFFRSVTICFFFFFTIQQSAAQQNNIWYFGEKAGINFNSGAGPAIPVALTNSAMIALEGCASICDANGVLLFYTNGETVYNRNHKVMANGSGLKGHVSSAQSALIVPQPGNDSIYFVFTGDSFEKKFVNGYNYSVINMSRDNGNGEVILKNVLLSASSTERLTAARHANGSDVWVITNDKSSNVFRSWLVSCDGLLPDPVVSTTGEILNEYDAFNSGSMKVSPDGKLLCQTHFPDIENVDLATFIQLFDFENLTGIISNPRKIDITGSSYYAAEFSPDSKLLYGAKAKVAEFDQFEATLGMEAAIIASRVAIPSVTGIYAAQAGPDKKIYLNRGATSLSVISNPNAKGVACNFEKDKIDLALRKGNLGLPSVINDLYFNFISDFTYQVTDSCKGIVQFQGTTNLGGDIDWLWEFGDGTTSTLQNPEHTYLQPGRTYTVKFKAKPSTACGYFANSKTITPAGASAVAAFDVVAKCDSGYVRFINQSVITSAVTNAQYIWEFGDGTTSTEQNPTHTFSSFNTFNVKLNIKTGNPCIQDSITKPVTFEQLKIQLPPDQEINAGAGISLTVTGGGTSFQWSPATWLSDSTIYNPVATPYKDITYTVNVSTASGCTASDSIFIKVNSFDDIFMPTAFTPNNDGLNDVLRPYIGTRFTLLEFSIYNRWGKRVFSTSLSGSGWNGSINSAPQDTGVYIWILKAKDPEGNPILKKGTATLLR